jgi:hypothetical protein
MVTPSSTSHTKNNERSRKEQKIWLYARMEEKVSERTPKLGNYRITSNPT